MLAPGRRARRMKKAARVEPRRGEVGVAKRVQELPLCRAPPHPRAVRGPPGGAIPSPIGGLQELVDGLAGNVAVNEDFGQALGDV